MSMSPAVLRFLAQCIDSVPQLETLVLLHADPQQWWAPAEVAQRLYSADDTAQLVLDHLTRRGLCVRRESPLAFRYASGGGLDPLVDEVIRTYRTNLVAVTRVIHLNAASGAREFARAFDLKKDN